MTGTIYNSFATIPRNVVLTLINAGASGREWAVLVSMLSFNMQNGDIGMLDESTPMTSRMIAEYSGLKTPDAVRHVLSSLVRKGVLVRARTVNVDGVCLSVYRLADMDQEDGIDRHKILRLVD